jgi:uncharacterized protein YegJ (DUF2314 family)
MCVIAELIVLVESENGIREHVWIDPTCVHGCLFKGLVISLDIEMRNTQRAQVCAVPQKFFVYSSSTYRCVLIHGKSIMCF